MPKAWTGCLLALAPCLILYLSWTTDHMQCWRLQTPAQNTPAWILECLESKWLSCARWAKLNRTKLFCSATSVFGVHISFSSCPPTRTPFSRRMFAHSYAAFTSIWRRKISQKSKMITKQSLWSDVAGPNSRRFPRLTEQYFVSTRWPSAEIVAKLVDKGSIFMESGWSCRSPFSDALQRAVLSTCLCPRQYGALRGRYDSVLSKLLFAF